MPDDLKRKTATALAWSLVQSWSIKFLSLLLFFVLARYLVPAQMGLAQSVTVLLAFVAVISEQGFHSAIVQRPGLRKDDVNLPFFLACTVACLASLVMYFFAGELAKILKEPAAENLLRVAAIIPPITAANGIAIAMLRRELDFKRIARATFGASLISGLLAVYLVTQGWGPMALVIQAALSSLIVTALIWSQPGWKPSTNIDTRHFKGITKFSSAAFASQLIDFFSGRLIDIIILGRFGLAALGIYAVGAKLYLTLLELLATGLMAVAMSAMAKLLTDRERLKRTYLRFLFIAACTTMPLFVGIASLAPEICFIIFGNKWDGAVAITHWLCLLGSVQVVQFFNGAALDATGNPRLSLLVNLTKLGTGATVLSLYPTDSLTELTIAFVVSQLCVTPLSFAFAMRVTATGVREVFSQITPGLFASSSAFIAIEILRTSIWIKSAETWFVAIVLFFLFGIVFISVLLMTSRTRLIREIDFVTTSYKTNNR
jgi:O-antigen/teichoic acid export membrane protein